MVSILSHGLRFTKLVSAVQTAPSTITQRLSYYDCVSPRPRKWSMIAGKPEINLLASDFCRFKVQKIINNNTLIFNPTFYFLIQCLQDIIYRYYYIVNFEILLDMLNVVPVLCFFKILLTLSVVSFDMGMVGELWLQISFLFLLGSSLDVVLALFWCLFSKSVLL